MYLRLGADDWDKHQLEIIEDQKDYNLTEDDRFIVFIYGYPFNPKTGKWVSGSYVISLYLKNDLNFIHEIEGIYTILVLDKINKIFLIITDRYGIYTLFFYQDENQFILSDKIAEIISLIHDVKLNEQSIAEYLYFGFKLGTKTHIQGVKELEGASIYKIDSELIMTKKAYWSLISKSKKDMMSRDEFRDIFNEHIKTAFKLEKNIVIPLSGGLDTRAILSSSIYQNLSFECYTNGINNAPDVKIAKKICNHLNIKHTFFEIDEDLIKNIPLSFKKGAWNYNGLQPPYFFLNLKSFCDYSKDKLIITGSLGNEIWRGLLAEKRMELMTKDMIVDIVMNSFVHNKKRLLDIYNGYNNQKIIEKIRESLQNELFASNDFKKPMDQFEIFVLKQWGSNWASNGFKSAGKYFKIFSAYLNKNLLPQIVLQNRNERINGTIQKYIISKNSSYLTKVKLDSTDIRHGASVNNDIGSRFKDLQAFFPRYSKAAVNYIPKRFFKKSIFKTPYFTDYPNWLRDYHWDFIQDVLNHDKMHAKDLFKKDELKNIIEMFLNKDDSLEPILTRVIGLELWLAGIAQHYRINISQTVPTNKAIMIKDREHNTNQTFTMK
jgi:hypothetical protein